MIDLGETFPLRQVVLHPTDLDTSNTLDPKSGNEIAAEGLHYDCAGFPLELTVQGSDDGKSWKDFGKLALKKSLPPGSGPQIVDLSSGAFCRALTKTLLAANAKACDRAGGTGRPRATSRRFGWLRGRSRYGQT